MSALETSEDCHLSLHGIFNYLRNMQKYIDPIYTKLQCEVLGGTTKLKFLLSALNKLAAC